MSEVISAAEANRKAQEQQTIEHMNAQHAQAMGNATNQHVMTITTMGLEADRSSANNSAKMATDHQSDASEEAKATQQKLGQASGY